MCDENCDECKECDATNGKYFCDICEEWVNDEPDLRCDMCNRKMCLECASKSESNWGDIEMCLCPDCLQEPDIQLAWLLQNYAEMRNKTLRFEKFMFDIKHSLDEIGQLVQGVER